MATIDILMPADQAEGTEATVGTWLKQVGDPVALHEPLVEITTDKVNMEVPAPAAGAPAVVYAAPFIHPPLGFGFGFLGCLAPLLFLLFFFGLLRLLFWAGPGRHAFHHAGCGPGRRGMNWEKGVPPFFEEWHRRAHQPEPPAGEAPQAAE